MRRKMVILNHWSSKRTRAEAESRILCLLSEVKGNQN
jgi:hypothetical protein